jgi:hypothetical protein
LLADIKCSRRAFPLLTQLGHRIRQDRGTDRYEKSRARKLLRLEARELDHLGPFFCFVGDELAELDGRSRKHRAAQVGNPRLHFGIGESRVDLLVELVDDIGGRIFRDGEAIPLARLIA